MSNRLNAFLAVIAFSAFLTCIQSAPLLTRKNLKKTASFLIQFGYIDTKSNNSAGATDPSSPLFKDAISNLQRFGNIPVTGRLDTRTLQLISTTRCGVKDPRLPSARGQSSVGEFNLHPSSWKKKDLTFKIISYTNDGIPHYKQRQIFRESFSMWEKNSALSIREVFFGPADILISFVRVRHGDDYPFDREGGTLAHAFYPLNNEGLAGDAHFDDDERFTTGISEGINLDWVALHEFGHSLGLEHSNVRESVMYPWYKGFVLNIALTNDDIQGIQERYGRPAAPTTPLPTAESSTTSPRPRTSTTSPRPRTSTISPRPRTSTISPRPRTSRPAGHPACVSGLRYDAVFVGADQLTYFLKGDSYWTVNRRLQKSRAKKIRARWADVRTPVDAAYRNQRGHIVFFKGSAFWEYSDPSRTLQRRGRITSYGLPLRTANMDAIFNWKGNNKTYVFKGRHYWRYNEETRRTDPGYRDPRIIQKGWGPGFPGNIDTATTWINGRSYVFKMQKYYRLKKPKQTPRKRSSYVEVGYPKLTARKWMKCDKSVAGRLLIGALESSP